MLPRRIVSLLPSTTEILFAVGAGDQVLGVTFECDHPMEARDRRIVSTSSMPEAIATGGSTAAIDRWVAEATRRGEDLYHLSAGALRDLDPDLVVTQDLCAVCAVDVSVVDDALAHLGCTADVLTVDPHTLEEVWSSILTLGARTGHSEDAEALVASLRARLDVVATRVADALAGRPRPRVMLLEWTEPPFAPGHWVPEMVTLAGGDPVLGRPGAKSRRVTWDDVHAAEPDVVVCAPCGFGRADSQRLADGLVESGVLPPGVAVHAVDANASWARPGPRLVDGIEELAELLHPSASES